jgi:hypothetical protein
MLDLISFTNLPELDVTTAEIVTTIFAQYFTNRNYKEENLFVSDILS